MEPQAQAQNFLKKKHTLRPEKTSGLGPRLKRAPGLGPELKRNPKAEPLDKKKSRARPMV